VEADDDEEESAIPIRTRKSLLRPGLLRKLDVAGIQRPEKYVADLVVLSQSLQRRVGEAAFQLGISAGSEAREFQPVGPRNQNGKIQIASRSSVRAKRPSSLSSRSHSSDV
jgi:hypothetical protein